MRKVAIASLLTALLTFGVVAQKKSKHWSEWSRKDAEKILNDSPWGQTQVETNTSEMTYTPTNGSSGAAPRTASPNSTATLRGEQADRNRNRASEGAYNQAVSINYQIRFLSAKPIREAFANMILLQQAGSGAGDQPKPAEKLKGQMQEFVDRDFGDYVVVVVSYESTDGRLSGKAFQDFNSAVAETLRNNTYLERQDGKRVFLMDYRAPIGDGLGARFVFPRTIDGQVFLNSRSSEVRFYSEVGPNVKLNRRFKVLDMVYHGKLEY